MTRAGAFEHALHERLVAHRTGVCEDPAPRSLLPLGPIALAALAVRVHGWDLQIESAYLPGALLSVPTSVAF
ncbi:Imm49 family immunity protein [Streptomyces sp. enrichment culture]|uniref:Imm49 family immunity protein n=1 Tax=Streptomyces sp. enrichment culture TaxID=1795815 RepID=UPI003F55A368